MKSVHHGNADGKPYVAGTAYVDEQRWYESILAGETIWSELGDYPRKCIVKYEDLIGAPDLVDRSIRKAFSLQTRPGVTNINQAKTNASRIRYKVARGQEMAMNGLRNADPSALSKPRGTVDIESPIIRLKAQEVIDTYWPSAPTEL